MPMRGLEKLVIASSQVAIDQIPQHQQRQDSLEDQMRDVRRAATKLGCYDAADWIKDAWRAA